VMIMFTRVKKRDNISTVIFLLSFADFLGSLSIAFSQIFQFSQYESFTMCALFRCLIHFFFVSSFCFTCCIAVQLFIEVKYLGRFQHTKYLFIGYHTVSWGIPSIIVVISLAAQSIIYSDQGWCHSTEAYEIALWFAPIGFTVLWNLFFYVLIIYQIWKVRKTMIAPTHANEQRANSMQLKLAFKLASLLLVFVVCWGFDFWNHLAQYLWNSCTTPVLYFLQDLFSPLQGFLNSIVYGLSTKELRRSFSGLFCWWRKDNEKSPWNDHQSAEPLISKDIP